MRVTFRYITQTKSLLLSSKAETGKTGTKSGRKNMFLIPVDVMLRTEIARGELKMRKLVHMGVFKEAQKIIRVFSVGNYSVSIRTE